MVSDKKRTNFNNGVRLTADERLALDALQAFARANGQRVSDSALMRALVLSAEVDEELASSAVKMGATASLCVHGTSINWMASGMKALGDLINGVAQKTGTAVSYTDVVRALIMRTKPDMLFLGILRFYVDREKSAKSSA